MTSATPPSNAAIPGAPRTAAFTATVWHAPLVPVALAATAGIVFDSATSLPLAISLLAAVAGLLAWLASRSGGHPGLALIYLWLGAGSAAAAYHHTYRNVFAADDISQYATEEPRPVQLQGVLDEEPNVTNPPVDDGLRSMTPATESTIAVLQATQIRQWEEWLPVHGRARLIISGRLEGMHIGDELEVVGRLSRPHSAANPGEFDYASVLRDQRIGALVIVRKTPGAVIRRVKGWPRSFFGWLGVLRCWGQRELDKALPGQLSGIAMALLLGDGSPMTASEWAKYMRTGVVHVLAISGQHLVVLAFFLWWLPRLLGIRRSRAAWFVALFLLGYSLLAGGRPPVMRSAVMVCVACGGIILRRPVQLANSFGLAWLVVAVLNPTDWYGAGCQLSFLAVAMLYWGTSGWFRWHRDPLQHLIEESRPPWQRWVRRFARAVGLTYAATAVIWLALAPLVAARFHLVSPIALLIIPPVSLLASIALVAGFLLLLAAAVCPPLVPVFAFFTRWSLAACDGIVTLADVFPRAWWYVPDLPDWWLWGFYPAFLAFLLLEPLRRRWRWAIVAGLLWICVGLLSSLPAPANGELRCTFLAVGHGGCAVIETPDGRVFLYDAGSVGGPDVTHRQIAPFLWQRGIRRIDEVFLSHADLDHFNGLTELVQRFAIGQVTCTPTFADKSTRGVHRTLAALQHEGIPIRIVHAGDRLSAGDVEIEVFHPPAVVPPGPKENENSRSLVLRIEHEGHTLLLTGDLVGPGLERVTALPGRPVDVMMAPHHGSAAANTSELARWARPRVVVSPQEQPQDPETATALLYRRMGATFLATWAHGAVTVRSRPGVLDVETYLTGLRLELAAASAR